MYIHTYIHTQYNPTWEASRTNEDSNIYDLWQRRVVSALSLPIHRFQFFFLIGVSCEICPLQSWVLLILLLGCVEPFGSFFCLFYSFGPRAADAYVRLSSPAHFKSTVRHKPLLFLSRDPYCTVLCSIDPMFRHLS